MGLGRAMGIAAALAGGVLASQAPEATQQYRQRLNGAVAELGQVVADFDADAARNGLERSQALVAYERAQAPFLRQRGHSMRRTINRLADLTNRSRQLAQTPALLRPLAVLRNPDGNVFSGTLRDFEPAVPVTAHGLVWAALGGLAGFSLVGLAARLFRRRRRRAAAR